VFRSFLPICERSEQTEKMSVLCCYSLQAAWTVSYTVLFYPWDKILGFYGLYWLAYLEIPLGILPKDRPAASAVASSVCGHKLKSQFRVV
jgi:hypothetical protein